MLDQQNHASGGANNSIMVGMFVCLCLPSKKPSKQEFFIPAGTDLGVKLLTQYRIFIFIFLQLNFTQSLLLQSFREIGGLHLAHNLGIHSS